MATANVIKQTRYDALPTGEYPAKIGAYEMTEGQFGTQVKTQVKLRFDVTAQGLEDRSIIGWAAATFSPKSKLYGWTRAAFGREIPANYDLNLDHLLDRPVVLVLVTKVGDDGLEYNKIDSLKPVGRNGAAQRPTAAPATRPANVTVPAAALTAAARPQPVQVNHGVAEPVDLPEWLAGAEDGDGDVPF
jgi:hypothetical protein